MCVLGYCIFPLVVAAFLCALWGNTVYHIIVVTVAFMWSTQGTAGAGGGVLVGELRGAITHHAMAGPSASVVFMSQLVPEKRKALAVFPVLLFYVFIGWMILIQ